MGRISSAVFGNKYVATFPDGSAQTINAGSHHPTHAVIGKLGGTWEANPCLTRAEAEQTLVWLDAHASYADLQVVPLAAA